MGYDVAFIGHLDSVEAYREALEALRGHDCPPLTMERVHELIPRMEPMPICDVALRSAQGFDRRGVYVDVFLLPTRTPALRAALAKVRAACRQAASTGARIGVLGGFSSIVGEQAGARLTDEFGLPFTTGNTLTAAVIATQAERAVSDLEAPTIAVVGAAGDVGSGVCRILHGKGLKLLLVGRAQSPLERLAVELPGQRVCSWAEAAPQADCAVLVASTIHGAISLERIRKHATVLDAGHPPNARPSPGLRYAMAGRVKHRHKPVGEIPQFIEQGGGAGEFHACLVEGEVLAYERRWEPFSTGRGNIRPEQAREIHELAQRHGIEPAPLHWIVDGLSGRLHEDAEVAAGS
jgi:fatty aldehyde-generating acyl-ACP reductase